jgi:hypothetical protein
MAQSDSLERLQTLFAQNDTKCRESTRQRFNPEDYKPRLAKPASYKKGGKVKKSGWALVHKGEKIISAARVLGRRRKKARRKRNPLKP